MKGRQSGVTVTVARYGVDGSTTIRRPFAESPRLPPDSRRLFGDAWGTRDGPVTMLEQC
jgi:hypothetical protein